MPLEVTFRVKFAFSGAVHHEGALLPAVFGKPQREPRVKGYFLRYFYALWLSAADRKEGCFMLDIVLKDRMVTCNDRLKENFSVQFERLRFFTQYAA